jgi:glycosyltransferase involved in cell wall biosynthesis
MKLSIIIPTKNEAELLPRLLTSIREQTFTEYEIIVADAHSNDSTIEIAKGYGAHVVEGGLPGTGRNRGAIHAQGELFLFLDADVVLPSRAYLADVLREFNEKGADIATCDIRPLSSRRSDQLLHRIYNAYVNATAPIIPHAPGFCLLVRRGTHETNNGFDEEVVFAEDMDYVQRAHKRGARFRILKSHPIHASVRRLEKDGRFAIAIKFAYAELRILLRGPFKKQPFRYEMGGTPPPSRSALADRDTPSSEQEGVRR